MSVHSISQHAYEAGRSPPHAHLVVDGSHDLSSTQQPTPCVPSGHWHMYRSRSSVIQAARSLTSSACTASLTRFWLLLLFELSPLRKKYLMAARRASDPHVKGDLESRVPSRLLSASPEHGSSNSLVGAPDRLRDQTGLATSGPGQMSTSSSAPSIRQSKYWCKRSPSALKTDTFRLDPSQSCMLSSACLTLSMMD